MKVQKGIISDDVTQYEPIPQLIMSDDDDDDDDDEEEDEGVYDESPDGGQLIELLPNSSFDGSGQSEHHAIADQNQLRPLYLNMPVTPPTVTMSGKAAASVICCGRLHVEKMSCARTACFLFTIFACVVYVVLVLWLIPCQLAPCLSRLHLSNGGMPVQAWARNYSLMHFTTDPQSTIVGYQQETVIVIAYRTIRDKNIPERNQTNDEPSLSGVLALRGTDGSELWKRPFYTDIIDVVCNVVDVNADGFSDCFVIGTAGLIAAMSASNGHIFWYLHNHDDHSMRFAALSCVRSLTNIDFDDDGVQDFAVVALLDHSQRNDSHRFINDNSGPMSTLMLLVSGGTGQTIGRPLPLPFVQVPSGNVLHNGTTFSLPNPMLFNFGNGSLALLLSSHGHDFGPEGTLSDSVHLMHVDDLYKAAVENCSGMVITEDGDVNRCFQIKETFSVKHNILSIYPVRRGVSVADDVLIYLRDGEMILLNGSNDFQPSWTFRVSGHRFSKPAFGFYGTHAVPDVFFTTTPINCSEDNCQSQVIIVDGQDGKILNKMVSSCTAFSPLVIADHLFFFKAPVMRFIKAEPTETYFTNTGSTIIMNTLSKKNIRKTMPSDLSKGRLLLPVMMSAFGGHGNSVLNLATGETTTCRTNPDKFHKTIIQSTERKYLLVNAQNKDVECRVSIMDLSLDLP